MTESRTGKNPLQKKKNESLYEPSDRKETPKETQTRGRPVQKEKWTKVTCVLFDSQIVWLDRLAADIREQTGAALSRAELIRAMISAVQEKGLGLNKATSEEEAKKIILGAMS